MPFCAPYARWIRLAEDAVRLPQDGDFGVLHAGIQRDERLKRALGQIWFRSPDGEPHAALWADAAILQITAVLLDLSGERCRAGRDGSGLAPWQLRRTTERMLARLDEDMSLTDLAALVGLSPYHFCRAFKRSTGLPPHRWLQQQRVEHAKRLLAESRLSVLEVALEVGYQSPGHFARLFRRETGLTPNAFRRTL